MLGKSGTVAPLTPTETMSGLSLLTANQKTALRPFAVSMLLSPNGPPSLELSSWSLRTKNSCSLRGPAAHLGVLGAMQIGCIERVFGLNTLVL